MIRLNLGCGPVRLDGYENLDIKTGDDVSLLERYETGTVDEVRASHVLEHFPAKMVPIVLREWVRVLRFGGVLKIAVPDFDWIVREYSAGSRIPTINLVCGGHVDENDVHHTLFNRELLTEEMRRAGLSDICEWAGLAGEYSSHPCSLNLQGTKNPPVYPRLTDTVLVVTMPRLMFVENAMTIWRAVVPLGVDVIRTTGVWWHEGITRGFERAIETGKKYVLTTDYDTVFTADNVVELHRILEERPDIDAVFSLQMRRGSNFPIFCHGDKDGRPVGKIELAKLLEDTTPMLFGHFGCTLLRTEKIATLPKPWFLASPDGDNTWREDHPTQPKLDADAYFWKLWRENGRTLHLANRSTVGHIEYVVTWPDTELKPIFQRIENYDKAGKPATAFA